MADLAETLVKFLLATIYFLIAFGSLLNAAINPEAYLLCFKLEGLKALLYLTVNGLAALALLTMVVRYEPRRWALPSLGYFAFHLAGSIIISTEIFGISAFSTISLTGLMLSLMPSLEA